MMKKHMEAEIVMNTSHHDASGMFAMRNSADANNFYNNNIHYHNFYELEFVISGSGVYEINHIDYPIKEGMLFLTTPADYHTYSLRSEEHFEFFNVQFRSEHIDSALSSYLYSSTEPISLPLQGEQFHEMYDLLVRLVRVYSEKQPMYALMMRNMIENICIDVAYNTTLKQPNRRDDVAVRKAVIFVKNNYRDRITLRDASEAAGLSEAYFSHIFSTTMGTGFSTYVRNIRLDAAANLLKSTDLSIKEICYKAGFGNRAYFTEAFREHFGTSPREYRASYLTTISSESDSTIKSL